MILRFWLNGIGSISATNSKITSCNAKFKQRTRTNRTSTRISALTQTSSSEKGSPLPTSTSSLRSTLILGRLKRNRTSKTSFNSNGISSKRPTLPTRTKMRAIRSIGSLNLTQRWRCVTSLPKVTQSSRMPARFRVIRTSCLILLDLSSCTQSERTSTVSWVTSTATLRRSRNLMQKSQND